MDLENKINKTRQESGVISNFETKMAELLQMQKEGKQEEAFVLAKELAMLKRKYINHSRGIRADAVRTKTLRHEYHLHKKTILNLQRYLHTQRESAIKERLESIRKRLSITKYQLERGDPNKREQFEKQLSLQEEKINNNTVILTMVRKQLGVLKKQEQILDNVIQHIHDQVEEVKSGKQAKPQEPQTETSPKKSEEDIPTMSEDQNKKSKRMVMRKYQDS